MNLPYGKSSLSLPDLWDGQAVWLEPGPFPSLDSRKVVEKALDEPVGSPAIGDMGLSGKRIACVVPDITRRAAVDVYLPIMLSRLLSAGALPESVTIIVGLGIHRPLKEKELKHLVGSKVWSRFRVVNHDPDDEDENFLLGVTSGGIPVHVNKTVSSADMVILTGSITYHYFAGYGGGRKALLPGVASRSSCEAHHRMVVSWRKGELAGTVAPGVLVGNPVHEQMLEACSLAPPCFTLNVVTDPGGKIIAAFSGELDAAHLEACRAHDIYYRREVNSPSKLVIASAGGYPKDINFVQAHKGLFGAHLSVEDGGIVVLLAQCSEGAGYREFFDWFSRCDTEESWLTGLDESYHINAQTAFSTWLRACRNPTILVSDLDPLDIRKTGMIPAGSVEEALVETRAILSELPVPIMLPDAADTLTVIKSGD
jgi:nickel-dependent lactate racemase